MSIRKHPVAFGLYLFGLLWLAFAQYHYAKVMTLSMVCDWVIH